jgi:hypothetical protein
MASWFKRHWARTGLLALLAICGFLLYSWIDTTTSLDYAIQEQKSLREDINILQSLLKDTGKQMSRSEIELLVKNEYKQGHIVKVTQNSILVDGVVLNFNGETLTEVHLLESTGD